MQDSVVVVGLARTPMGGMQGDLANVAAPVLGSVAIKAALERASVAEFYQRCFGEELPESAAKVLVA